LTARLARIGLNRITPDDIKQTLRGKYAQGDVDKAYKFLVLAEDSNDGILKPYDPALKLVGAVNRDSVTCYLDSVLFAMFARLPSFEAMLYKSFEDEARQNLTSLLRLWVNMLRSGMLIPTDTTHQIQKALKKCGWADADSHCQQDASEAFSFITEHLHLPLLTLKMDIFHTGRESAEDDHKFINERLLEVAIPPEPADGKPITLEDCLEIYFNNRIEVKRYLQRRGTNESLKAYEAGYSLPIDVEKSKWPSVEAVELGSTPGTPSTPTGPPPTSSLTFSEPSRNRTARVNSIIRQRITIDGVEPEDSMGKVGIEPSNQRRKSSVKREVLMPAWQFFSLIRECQSV
jgi:hypothetical protein